VELLGDIHGCGYRDGACLVRRQDGQMVQLGPLQYALLESIDGQRDGPQLAEAMSERLDRRVNEKHVLALAKKLAAQGLLAGFEGKAPPRANPLLALRWKVLVTNPKWTRRLTAPFSVLFRPWIMWPILAAFAGVFWFVLIHHGVASATSEAFRKPGLFLIVFALAIVSAGFHELGHAAAARYGGSTPGGMGMGLYLVWPAFYTDVTDAYRLPKRDRLRVDLAGLYFNAAIAVLTMGVWLLTRIDALLLLVALQVLQMVKQLSPVIRADGYHILSDATGVPDLFAHMIPTVRRLLPGHRHEPSALTGRARLLVTAWVLIVVPVLLSLMIGAIVLLPHLATSAWNSAQHIGSSISKDASHGQILDLLAGVVSLVALILPVLGSVLITQKITRTTVLKAHSWSRGRPVRRSLVLVAGAAAIALMIWAWWPSGQYQPIPARGGTLAGLVRVVGSPASEARPVAQVAPVQIKPGTHLALAMIPIGGATKQHPALFIIKGQKGKPPVAIYSTSTPAPPTTTGPVTQTQGSGGSTTTTPSSTSSPSTSPSPSSDATAFPFKLPAAPGPGGTQALATNTTNGGVKYDVAYSLVTVKNGAPVTNTNSAYAIAHCQACTTVAVSFQIVLVIGTSKDIAPINAAGALNYDCPACTTTAIADQIVITLNSQPSHALLAKLEQALKQLNALPALGAGGTPTVVASQVATVQQEVETALNQSGLVANPPKSSSSSSNPSSGSTTSTSTTSTTPSTSSTTSQSSSSSGSPSSSSPSSSSSGSSDTSTTPTTSTTTSTTSSSTPTTTTPASTTTTTSSSTTSP